jgi:hypothetical protein
MPEETPLVEPTTVVALALPSTLGEEKRDEGDGPRMVFPPRNLRKVTRCKVQRKSHKADTVDQANPRTSSPTCASAVSMIKAVAFKLLMKQPDIQVFQVSISELSADQTDESDPDLSLILEEYHSEFANVFSKKEAETFPEHCSYDHTIPLQEGTSPPFAGHNYSLSPAELKVLDKYIKDNLRKGFIVTNGSSMNYGLRWC